MPPFDANIPQTDYLYGNKAWKISLHPGVTTLVGPNGTGKTQALRNIRAYTSDPDQRLKTRRFVAAGRSAPLENYRSANEHGTSRNTGVSAVGNSYYLQQWAEIESVTGDFFALEQRADLRLKVEARLQQFFQRSLNLEWGQTGLRISIQPTDGSEAYAANHEASGILHLASLLASIHNDEIGLLVIDEPEISLHPQHQAFILDEIKSVAGDPASDPEKKLVVIATHSPSMLGVTSVADLSNLVFFNDRKNPPIQLSQEDEVLKGSKLAALIARLTATHRLAFFAQTVLLVEGPSDEIIATQLARALNHPLLPLNAQVVPVTGKGEFPEVAKFFRKIGKRVIVLADLDALADSNELVNAFNNIPGADAVATSRGAKNLAQLDSGVRNDFNQVVTKSWDVLEPLVNYHSYWTSSPERGEKAKRRATLAVLLGNDKAFIGSTLESEMQGLRNRFRVLLEALNSLGCHVLRRGTIEDYFKNPAIGTGKPEVAANESSDFADRGAAALESQYDDVLRAVYDAAPGRRINEDEPLRIKLASLIGAVFQFMQRETTDEKIKAMAKMHAGADAELFQFKNTSTVHGSLSLQISMASPLFQRAAFPFEIRETDNLSDIIRRVLPGV